MPKQIIVLISFFFCFHANGQFDHEAVFPELSGDDLLEALQDNYTAETILSFSKARDTLFSVVWGRNDSLRCVYTDYPRYMDPDEDPTQAVYNDGQANGINTEHSYPQSKGAGEGNARADMHHLYPSRVDVNGTRAALPFAEIPDNETSTWFYDDNKMSSIPTMGIDNYSEATGEAFEVREAFKGNIARAIMYFYTIYRSKADAADPDYFEIQREALCDWHYEDPVDEEEWNNTFKIASYQEGKANPFVLDCSVATRLYCDGIDVACMSLNADDFSYENKVEINPNPTGEFLNILSQDKIDSVQLISLKGQLVFAFDNPGTQLDVSKIPDGIYFLHIQLVNHRITKRLVIHH